MPFGVTLPENTGSESAPETQESTQQTQGEAPEGQQDLAKDSSPETTKEILDLDKLERFRFQGKEWSPKDLRDAYLMRQDYTKKTQELAEARKYADNFEADLDAVLENPELMDKFREIYPKAYVDVAERVLSRATSQAPQEKSQPREADPRDRELAEIKAELAQWKQEKEAERVRQNESWLNNQLDAFSRKYPEANQEVVLARAQVFCDQNRGVLTEKDLERIFKKTHEEFNAAWEKRQKEKINKQLEANSRAKDTGQGGGIPSGAPKGFKTIKEATAQFLADIKS